jgi:DNA-binding response OmpR family regulator
MARILVVEDDRHLSDMIFDWLSAQKHAVDVTHDGFDGIERSQSGAYDLLVLDWNLPRITGIDICKEYRSNGGTSPVLMLTGKKEINEKAKGFEAGADDYLTKPFHPQELCMRVQGLLRRAGALDDSPLEVAGISVDVAQSQAIIQGQAIDLTVEELSVLQFFLKHPDKEFALLQLLEELWPTEKEIEPNDVAGFVHSLNEKLGNSLKVNGTRYRLSS